MPRNLLTREITTLGGAKAEYVDEGIRLLEFAQKAYPLHFLQKSSEQRRSLDVTLSNCRLVDGTLEHKWKRPFDLLDRTAFSDNWRGGVDVYRTLCLAPPADVRQIFELISRPATEA